MTFPDTQIQKRRNKRFFGMCSRRVIVFLILVGKNINQFSDNRQSIMNLDKFVSYLKLLI